MNKNIAIYADGEIELKISVNDETIWLTQKQIAELFDREITRDISHYNLDVIISIGYRVNSIKATKLCQWATYLIFNDECLILNKKRRVS